MSVFISIFYLLFTFLRRSSFIMHRRRRVFYLIIIIMMMKEEKKSCRSTVPVRYSRDTRYRTAVLYRYGTPKQVSLLLFLLSLLVVKYVEYRRTQHLKFQIIMDIISSSWTSSKMLFKNAGLPETQGTTRRTVIDCGSVARSRFFQPSLPLSLYRRDHFIYYTFYSSSLLYLV